MMKLKTISFLTISILMVVGCKNLSDKQKRGIDKVKDTLIKSDLAKEENQISFHKLLTEKGISYDITSTGEGSFCQLTIKPIGLEVNKIITLEVEGQVVNAEIADLNSDQFPEVLVYVASVGSGSYGDVIGFSPNKGKSLSQIYFPAIADNAKVNKGYMGHDQFAIEGNALVQKFPIYKDGDANSNPTGNMKVIKYRMEEGEGGRKFVVDKITEIPR